MCAHPGCAKLVQRGKCEQHARSTEKEYDALRGTATQRGYDARWRAARIPYLRLHPLCECEDCKRAHCALPAQVIDHIIDHKGDMKLFWDERNWRAMNKSCHDRKTRRTNPPRVSA
jgi:5-methylcytosine-specific restriction protein A